MKKIILLIIFILVMSASANALLASISKPKMVLYRDFEGQPISIEESVIVKNSNDYDVKIMVEPADDFKEIAVIEETSFLLAAGEEKEVPYTVTINSAGTYNGKIVVYFNEANNPSTPGAALAQVVKVVVSGEGNVKQPEIKEPPKETPPTNKEIINEINKNNPIPTGDVAKPKTARINPLLVFLTTFTVVVLIIAVFAYVMTARGGKNE